MLLNILLLLFSAVAIRQNMGLDLFHHLHDESTSTPQLKLQHSSASIIICNLYLPTHAVVCEVSIHC